MKLIFKYLKKYWFFVLIVVGLTFIQVQTELSLPDYMSDIVTNGIQYGGITQQIPNAICEDDMNDVLLFMSNTDANKVLDNYELVTKDSTGVVDNQEIKFNTNTYLLKENHDDIDTLMQ